MCRGVINGKKNIIFRMCKGIFAVSVQPSVPLDGASLKDQMMKNPDDPVIVYAGFPVEAELVRHELENNDIPAFLIDETIGTIAPWHVAPGGAGAVKVTVAKRHMESARDIIQKFLYRH